MPATSPAMTYGANVALLLRPPFFWLSSTFRSGFDLVACASRATSAFGVA